MNISKKVLIEAVRAAVAKKVCRVFMAGIVTLAGGELIVGKVYAQGLFAHSIEVKAPETSKKVTLHEADPAKQVLFRLGGWYCADVTGPYKLETSNAANDLMEKVKFGDDKNVSRGAYSNLLAMNVHKFFDVEVSPIIIVLAPTPGLTNIEEVKYCWTKVELETLKNRLMSNVQPKK